MTDRKGKPPLSRPPLSRWARWKIALAAFLIRQVVVLLGATCKLRILRGWQTLEEVISTGQPVVLSYWHDRTFFGAYFLVRHLISQGYPVTILVSHSKDGELGVHLAHRWGAQVVRGSASRGGAEGLRRLYRAVARHRSSVVVIPDGPRGPKFAAKPGALVLAQLARIPILPLGFAARRYWTLGSWDRMIIPKPFTAVTAVIGEPVEVPREFDGEATLVAEQERLKGVLDALVEDAEGGLK